MWFHAAAEAAGCIIEYDGFDSCIGKVATATLKLSLPQLEYELLSAILTRRGTAGIVYCGDVDPYQVYLL